MPKYPCYAYIGEWSTEDFAFIYFQMVEILEKIQNENDRV
jgi:hypothetical protein